MPKHDEARRAFLVGAAVGAGAVASAGLLPEAHGQSQAQQTTAAGPAATHAHSGAPGHGAFLNDEDAATVRAFTERLMPGAPGKPGARDANVMNYIDHALSGAYADLQDFYRRGLAALDAYCRQTHKEPFRRLPSGRQDEVIAALEEGKATGFTWPSRRPFSTRCARTPWKACSPTRSTAATRTSPAGASSVSRARNRSSRMPTWRARKRSPACP